MIDDQNILIESHSLKAVRIIRNRFIENGFIIMRDKDTEKTLTKKILTKEHEIYPKAVELFAKKKLSIKGRRVRISS